MKIDDIKCKCGNDNFFMTSGGVFCGSCGRKVLKILYLNPNELSYQQVLSEASKICAIETCNKCKLKSVCSTYVLNPSAIIDCIEELKELV